MEENIVLSLTTIKSRIKNLPKILSSILSNNKSKYTIHIFYSETQNIYDEGCSDDDIIYLIDYINSVKDVHIKISEVDNIGPYRKIIPALKIYKNSIIITIDDDEIFESKLVDLFVESYNKYKCIICSVGRIVDIGKWHKMNDSIEYYKKIFTSDKPYMNILPEGYGGILYHTDMFCEDFINYDYTKLDKNMMRNDDIFLRNYTYNKGIPVFINYIYQSNIYNTEQIDTLFKSNKDEPLSDLIGTSFVCQEKFLKNYNNDFDTLRDILELINLHDKQKNDIYKRSVHTGTDVKKLQYKINYNETDKYIDLNKIIREKFFNGDDTKINTVLINIEKDAFRYETAVREFKKFLVTDFVHLKATYWREKNKFIEDMNNILKFMSSYNKNICIETGNSGVSLNVFSEFDDKNIKIQDGPLACYCSHVRGIIYGFLNFSNYTIIVEDDFHVNNIDLINENICKIPEDWDIICFGAQPINRFYEGDFYKFSDLFHSTQFYVIRNSCMKTIFENIYPIYDQIDILLSKLHGILNIYNIPNSVLQKNFESNTQNNLYVIYNSPNYKFIRICIDKIKNILNQILCSELKIVKETCHIKNIVLKILFDVIFSKILCVGEIDKEYFNKSLHNDGNMNDTSTVDTETCDNNSTYKKDINENVEETLYTEYFIENMKEKLYAQLFIVMNSCVKGINVDTTVKNIISDIYNIINGFKLNTHECIVPLNYGSTSNVYLVENENTVIKIYNKNLRWKCYGHSEWSEIIKREIEILNRLQNNDNGELFQKVFKCEDNKIYMEYTGETLFDHFELPDDWITQLEKIFNGFNNCGVYYPEFNLKNITLKNGKIYIIDFGLANIEDDPSEKNQKTLDNFIEFISAINDKFKSICELEQQHIYYNNFINNLKIERNEKYMKNIF